MKIFVQTNLEEAKAQEVAKLQNSLQEIQSKLEETNALLIKERENVKKVVEEAPPVIQETQVVVEDTEKIDALTGEVENLKVQKIVLTSAFIQPYFLACICIYGLLSISEACLLKFTT